MLTKGHFISVLVRTRDIESHFSRLLQNLSSQTLQPSELVVVDDFSSKSKLNEMINLLSTAKKRFFDNSVQMRLVPITDREFSHAYSVNVGIFITDCDLVCVTNGHCLPLSEMWLESGVTHFRKKDVAGVGGYTLPHKQGTTWEKLAYNWGWRRLNELSKSYVKDSFFSTVNCILRKSLWGEYPFDEKMPEKIPEAGKFGGEDYDWAIEMLARGHKIVVEPRFDVYHSHGEGISQLVPKYLTWRRIRKEIQSFSRPRESYTRLKEVRPYYYDL